MTSAKKQPAAETLRTHHTDPWERWATFGVAVLLTILLAQGLPFILESSQTSDEAAHLAAGYSYLKTGDFRLNPEHPPLVKELAAFPLLFLPLDFPRGSLWAQAEEWNIGRLFVHENRVSNDTILLLGRLPILGLSMLLGLVLFRWTRRLFGARAGVLALALYVLDPNVVAHSGLVTTDIGVTLFIFLSVYALWSWSESPSPGRLARLGLVVGATFATKYTALWLPPILGTLAIVLLALRVPLPERPWAARSPAAPGSAFGVRRLTALSTATLLVAVVAILVLAIAYGVQGLPQYLTGLDQTLTHSAKGHRAYLMGNYSDTGWWYYFLVAYLLKTPPGTLLIVGLSLLAPALGLRPRLKDALFLYVPILFLLVITGIWNVNIGLRHLLPIYPFLYVGAGGLLAAAPVSRPRQRLRSILPFLVAACLGWNLVEAASITPYNLAYFNRLAGGPDRGHHSLLDSNLDWGQASKSLNRYLDQEQVPAVYLAFSNNSDPWYYGVRYQYLPGPGNLPVSRDRLFFLPEAMPRELLAISADVLHSVHFADHTLYAWLRERQPIARPGYAYFVYDITGDARAHSYLAVICLNYDLPQLAGAEARRSLQIDPHNALARAVLERLSG